MTLYEMTREMTEILFALENAELTDEEREQIVTDQMEAIGADEKLDAYAKIVRQLEADAAACKAEADRLAKARKRAEDAAERMKDAVAAFLDATGKDKEQTKFFKFSFRSSQSAAIDDIDLVPEQYRRVKTTIEADKTAIKRAILAGEEVPGAHIETGRSVQIK